MRLYLLQKEKLTPKIQEQCTGLFNELNSNIKQLSLEKVLENENQILIVLAEEKDQLIGMASMALYKVISGYKGMIEDVVVSRDHRGKGIGRKLMEELLKIAKVRNLTEVLLFSGHHREAAINLYKSLGFVLKNSGLYRLPLN